jgi:glycogen debranching enzyme
MLENPNEILKTSGEHPVLLKKALRGEVSIQTVFILNSLINFIPKWQEKIQDTVVWPNYDKLLLNYRGFLKYDINKCKQILRKVVS